MRDYVIFTDSTSDLTKEIVDKFKVKVLPLKYTMDGVINDDFAPGDEAGIKNFYNLIKSGKTVVTTQFNPEYCAQSMLPYLKNGSDILFIAISSGLSGTYNSIKLAVELLSEQFPNQKIFAIDSLCASLGEGMMVCNAIKLKNEGWPIEKVADWLEKNKLKHCHLYTVSDLQYLHRGGRLSKTQAFFGTLLNIKPLLYVDNEGKLKMYGKARSKKKAFEALASKIAADGENLSEQTIFISHSDAEEDANLLANIVKDKCNVKNIIINYIGAVIGSHTGQGTLAIFYFGKKRM